MRLFHQQQLLLLLATNEDGDELILTLHDGLGVVVVAGTMTKTMAARWTELWLLSTARTLQEEEEEHEEMSPDIVASSSIAIGRS